MTTNQPPPLNLPPLAVTMGDPAGIGPDITLQAWHQTHERGHPFFYIGDASHLSQRANQLGLSISVQKINHPCDCVSVFRRALPVLHMDITNTNACGTACPENAPAIIQSITTAVELVTHHHACAIVTNPINKAVLYSHGFTHRGHTEFLASLTTGVESDAIMMMTCDKLRVVPLTTHVSIRDAIDGVTPPAITNMVLRLYDECVHKLDIVNPRIAVAGLNPHAGEQGAMGYEDMLIIAPALEQARYIKPNLQVTGPLPADTLFYDDARRTYDIALCMYHDQALIPLKTLDFHGSVNVTLGLPIIRTSPDHGTAFAIAGTGTANPSSLVNALTMAFYMAHSQQEL